MDAVWRAQGRHLDGIQAAITRSVDNNFIDLADAQALGRLEAFLRIRHSSPRTLAERRNIIKAFIIGRGRVGQREIKELIAVFTDGEISVAFARGVVYIVVTRDFGDPFNLYDVNMVLDNRLPAHLALDITDNALPVSVRNEYNFRLHDLAMLFAIRNSTAGPVGKLLDGARLLDGTWLLGGSGAAVMRLAGFHMAACIGNYAEGGQGRMHSLAISPLRIRGIRQRLTGQVTMTGSWLLDGTHSLDGSQSLGQSITKEGL